MKITRLIASEKGNNDILVFVDGEYFVTLNLEVVFKLGLNVDKELDIETLDAIKLEQDFLSCYHKALAIVSKMSKTKKQLKDYLLQKGFHYTVINQCIEKLEKVNLINDDLYCKKYIEQEKNKKGKMIIYKSLLTKGIEKEIIEQNISIIHSQKETVAYFAKKFMKNKTYDYNTIQKLKRHLLSKGFSFEEINAVVGEDNESWD
ncbi:MAG: RecX family transcriptional regulator [Clostridia bacterium]|nr:RecX family transcriptional regulator [Clostridia bacterium]